MYSRSAELALLYCRDWQGRLKKGSIQVVEKCSTNGYDIIGDIHGHGTELIALLDNLGYFHDGISYCHPEGRRALFLGDFIDRGPHQRLVLQTVMPMVERGSARAIMGNHEFNAILFHTKDPENPGSWLRERSDKNINQHLAFLSEYLSRPEELANVIEWFKQLPLWIDIEEGPRLIHACWHDDHIESLRSQLGPGNTLTDELILEASRKETDAYTSIEVLLKGLEVPIREKFRDKDGNLRSEVRTRWWINGNANLQEVALPPSVSERLPAEMLAANILPGYCPEEKPVFFGHYWWKGKPEPLADNVACLDYSVAKGGSLVAYRWDRCKVLHHKKYVAVSAHSPAASHLR